MKFVLLFTSLFCCSLLWSQEPQYEQGVDPCDLPSAVTFGEQSSDQFSPNYQGVENYEFTIYNRWGNLIFQSTDPSEAWDGTYNVSSSKKTSKAKMQDVPAGVYFYVLQIGNVDCKGNLTVLR